MASGTSSRALTQGPLDRSGCGGDEGREAERTGSRSGGGSRRWKWVSYAPLFAVFDVELMLTSSQTA